MRLIVLLILSLSILSCGQNILGPENIPPPTDFYIPPDTIPGNVDIEPIPAPDGTVFGGLGKRFIYKGKWHVLVDNIYHYEPTTKTLTKKSSKSLIRLDDEENISIIVQNMDDDLWGFYNSDNLVIDENKISKYYIYHGSGGSSHGCEPATTHYYEASIDKLDGSASTVNLTELNETSSSRSIVKYLPELVCGGGEIDFNASVLAMFFDNYYYTLGADVDEYYYTTYKRIHKDKDGSVNLNWEKLDGPWHGRQYFNLPSAFRVSRDGKRLFISDGRVGVEDGVGIYNRTVWATTDGMNWEEDTRKNYNNAIDIFPNDQPTTPLEPHWAKNTKNFYYKMDKAAHSIPVPYDSIKAAADRGETNFVVTDEHKNSYNNFLISTKHPDKANNEDWKALKINNYTKSSMHWVSSPEYLFAFGDKLIRFVDYDMIDSYYDNNTSQEQYNDLMKDHKKWYSRGNNGGDGSYSQRDCYEQSMILKAKADVMSAVLHADKKDVYPDEAVRHYLLEFYH